MQLTILSASLIAAVSAMPRLEPRNGNYSSPFSLTALRDGEIIHLNTVNAAGGGLRVLLPDNGADCAWQVAPAVQPPTKEAAYFRILSGQLALYTAETPAPLVYTVDGMGQGVIQYASDTASFPRNAAYTGWALSDDPARPLLTFQGKDRFIACPDNPPPPPDGTSPSPAPWKIWLDAGVAQPGGGQGCVYMSLAHNTLPGAPQCEYTPAAAA